MRAIKIFMAVALLFPNISFSSDSNIKPELSEKKCEEIYKTLLSSSVFWSSFESSTNKDGSVSVKVHYDNGSTRNVLFGKCIKEGDRVSILNPVAKTN
ncbi:hypothetical protein [Erwinia aphidicola]|uniref:hypothetical protein n=1 Tax=Erwinia aphidicola TaxID=68334 RepID=UPI003D1FE2A9